MNDEQKKTGFAKFHIWLQILYYMGTLATLFFIVAQVFYAKRTMVESSEWEKAKVTIENIERLKENLKETALYGKFNELILAGRLWADFTTIEGYKSSDTLNIVYNSFFDDKIRQMEDFEKTLSILDAFAYPIIMGYASEQGSFNNTSREYYTMGSIIMPLAFGEFINIGKHAKLLYRLWRVRVEQMMLKSDKGNDYWTEYFNNMLCFDEDEVTLEALKRYEKKLEKELEKIQKEITVFRKNSLK